MQHRRVDVFDLAKQSVAVSGQVELADLPRLAEGQSPQPAADRAVAPLRYELRGFVDERRRPAAVLRFSGEIDLVCDRCGAPLRWPLQGESRYFFVHTEDELARLPVDEADEEPLLGSPRFDLAALLEDEGILALPMSPRHEDCQQQVVLPPSAHEQQPDKPNPFAQLSQLKARRS